MRDIAIILYFLALVPMILRWPFLGILGWSVVSYMNPHQLGWAYTESLPFAMLVGLATIFAFVIQPGRKSIPLQPLTILLAVFFGYTTLTTLFAVAPTAATSKYVEFFKIMLMTFLTIPLMASRERIHALVWVIVLGVGFYGVKGGIFTLITGGDHRVWGPPHTVIADNNQLATALIMLLPLVRYLHLQTADKWVRYGLLLAMVFIGVSIVGSYSRGAFLACFACLTWMFLKSRHKLPVFMLGLGLVVFMLFLMPDQWFSRMQSIEDYASDPSVQGRFDAWTYALRLAEIRPLIGGGFAPNYNEELFMTLVPDAFKVRSFHSIYFEVLGEHGWPGLILFLTIGVTGLVTAQRIAAQTRDRPDLTWAHDLASMVQVSLVGFAVGGTFLNLSNFDLYYHILILLVLTRVVIAPDLAKAPEPFRTRPATAGGGAALPGSAAS
ncbi:putative O-glycosylation ligase, exosortase A system-associated [Caenispirillum bisanense]|uniref:Probable O-glycosylation ligase, exosortase A-associated n=1 Tax=Caenispirillum bisanense TaxID=414052 RepID=A0A286GS37_9PROT|nr:putative O-glycosylation ligase, exosortase A system-associated [Caenispirillum bisanense]SOD97754.1 probable O-glycosylation ligase, exosortase A-associated [Caenispirillum bisanense]